MIIGNPLKLQWNPAPRHPPVRQWPPIRHFLKILRSFSIVLSILAIRHFQSKAGITNLKKTPVIDVRAAGRDRVWIPRRTLIFGPRPRC